MFNIIYLLFLIVKAYIYFLQRVEIIPLIKFSLIWPFILFNCIINNIFLLLDNIFFDFQNISIKSPLFILGFPRSGTTFLQRFLVKNGFGTGTQLWQMIYSSIILQKILKPFLPILEYLSPAKHHSTDAHKTSLASVETDDAALFFRFL